VTPYRSAVQCDGSGTSNYHENGPVMHRGKPLAYCRACRSWQPIESGTLAEHKPWRASWLDPLPRYTLTRRTENVSQREFPQTSAPPEVCHPSDSNHWPAVAFTSTEQ
jgi:hypothetical protein